MFLEGLGQETNVPVSGEETQGYSFRRVPPHLWNRLGDEPGREVREAITDLLERRAQERIIYLALGSGGERRSVRLPVALYERMRKAAKEDGVNVNEWFVTALRYRFEGPPAE